MAIGLAVKAIKSLTQGVKMMEAGIRKRSKIIFRITRIKKYTNFKTIFSRCNSRRNEEKKFSKRNWSYILWC